MNLNGKEICAYRKVCVYMRMVYDTAHFFLGLPVHDRAAVTDSLWPLSAPFEDTVSGKETGN